MNANSDPSQDDPRLLQATQEYLAELEAGQRPERRAFVARFPGLAEALAPYLDALDAVHAGGARLHQLSASPPLPATAETLPSEPLGDFRIVSEIGRGGMGVVYEAIQLSLGRRVALKVLPFAAALDAKQLQRFKNEAQAAAHLHHPNIVAVYAVGMERGVHFYAMELIEGQNLASLVAELRGEILGVEWSHSVDQRNVSTGPYPPALHTERVVVHSETRLSLGAQLTTQRSERGKVFFRTIAMLTAQAAEALEYAHGVGIVHRDVKPANLLVDAQRKVWVTDFGLAQFHADAALTQSGDLLGTLRYMSPEQAGGQRVLIDHRTDIYSLGATLYELLTLRPIFDGADRQALLNQILYEEPTAPRSLDRAIPAELETIVLKAIAKAPADRYVSARELADDLQRFLDDVPIQARRPTLLEKATKWARRHRAVVASGLAALLLCLAGLSLATALTLQAYAREREKAQEAQEQREKAEESFHQAREAVDQFTRISEEELAGNPFLEGVRKRLLETALLYYQDFINQRGDDPKLQAELKASRAKVEAILDELITLMGASQYALLQREPVQEDLHLTDSQRQALARIDQRWREGFREAGRFPSEEREQRKLQLARDQESEVAQLLTPNQFRRFKEIALQQRGPLAFTDTDVAASLGLTAAQKRKIREIVEGVGRRPPRFQPPGGGPRRRGPQEPPWEPPGERPRKRPEQRPAGPFRDSWKKALEQILALLKPEQKRKWQELTGEPFAVEGFPGPGRPPGLRP
jgi:serine/threonine protein kinase